MPTVSILVIAVKKRSATVAGCNRAPFATRKFALNVSPVALMMIAGCAPSISNCAPFAAKTIVAITPQRAESVLKATATTVLIQILNVPPVAPLCLVKSPQVFSPRLSLVKEQAASNGALLKTKPIRSILGNPQMFWRPWVGWLLSSIKLDRLFFGQKPDC